MKEYEVVLTFKSKETAEKVKTNISQTLGFIEAEVREIDNNGDK